jgi:hypothetical protein
LRQRFGVRHTAQVSERDVVAFVRERNLPCGHKHKVRNPRYDPEAFQLREFFEPRKIVLCNRCRPFTAKPGTT